MQALMAPLCWASAGHRATSFSLFGDVRWAGRNKHGAPRPHNGPHGVMSSGSDPATSWEQEGADPSCPFLSTHCPGAESHPGMVVGFWQPWAPALRWDRPAFTAKGSTAPSLCTPLLRKGMGQVFPGVSWGDWIHHTPVSVWACMPMLTLVMFSGTKIIFHQRLEVST